MRKQNKRISLTFVREEFLGVAKWESILPGLFVLLMLCVCGCGNMQTAGMKENSPNGLYTVLRDEILSGSEGVSEAEIVGLTVEYRENPLGIDEEVPVFGWRMESDKRGQIQTAYRICVADSLEHLEAGEFCWDSGKIQSDISVAIPYKGVDLQPKTRYFWGVIVWDSEEKVAFSEENSWFETGLMQTGWDGAKWIGVEKPEEAVLYPSIDESCRYTIEYDFQGAERAESGIVFGADTGQYGEYYVWTLGIREGKACLKMCRMDDYCTKEEEYCFLDGYYSLQDFQEKQIHIRIEVDGTRAVTFMDGVEVARYELPAVKGVGRIGLYGERTDAVSYIDNILVLDETGQEIYKEEFESDNDSIFSPNYVTVDQGRGFIRAGITMVPGGETPAPYLRKKFEAEDSGILSARLYASALGIYQININGEQITENYFDPGQMVYDKELNYCSYDITDLLKTGENEILTCLGHGCYDRAVGTMNSWTPWGKSAPAFLAKVDIQYQNGTKQTVVTDESWEVSQDGPVRSDDMYQGEIYDASRVDTEWDWKPADTDYVDEQFRTPVFRAHVRERVRNTITLQPTAVTNPKPGVYVYDFGQEFTGVCRIRVKGQTGECITLRHAEALNTEKLINRDDAPGTVWTRNLLTARNTDHYYLKGEGEESYSPSMSCRAFRYVQISGLDEDTQILGVEGLVLMTDMEETGSFESSDIWLNRIYHNIYWTQRSNFLDIPTDCPQRDERFGWAGDIGAFSSTAVYNMQTSAFLEDYLRWLRLQQRDDGAISDMAPHTESQDHGNNGWGDAVVLITWELYQQYADIQIIEDNFEAMCGWVDYLVSTSVDGIRAREKSYGDHLQYHSTPQQMTDTAQSAYSALLLSKMAGIVGDDKAEEKYWDTYEMFRTGWQNSWLEENGLLKDGTQTAYALGLRFGLYPEDKKRMGEEFLLACVQWIDHHPSCGYVGMPHLLPALSEAGFGQDAYQVLLQKTAPSWNHQIALGATTIPEAWTGYTGHEDGKYSLYGSLNHYTLGSVGEWFYSGILGIQSVEDAPGFKKICLQPQVTDLIQYAGGGYTSVYGRIESRWENTEDGYSFHVTIPANTSATLILPTVPGSEIPLKAEHITESSLSLEQAEGIRIIGQKEAGIMLELVSGTYEFRVLR